jgi:hypothetical protein
MFEGNLRRVRNWFDDVFLVFERVVDAECPRERVSRFQRPPALDSGAQPRIAFMQWGSILGGKFLAGLPQSRAGIVLTDEGERVGISRTGRPCDAGDNHSRGSADTQETASTMPRARLTLSLGMEYLLAWVRPGGMASTPRSTDLAISKQ